MSNRASRRQKARRGNRRTPPRDGSWLLFTNCTGCTLCDLLAGTDETVTTIHELPPLDVAVLSSEKARGPAWQPDPSRSTPQLLPTEDQR